MSFDTTFNFTPFANAISAGNTRDQQCVLAILDEIEVLSNATYSGHPAVAARLGQLKVETSRLNTNIAKRGDVTAQIQELVAITQSEKAILYNLYTLCGDNAPNFMARMLFNYTAMLADTHITLLLTQSTNEQTEAAVAKLIYQSYATDAAHAQILSELVRAGR